MRDYEIYHAGHRIAECDNKLVDGTSELDKDESGCEDAQKVFIELYEAIEQGKRTPWLMFDVDGVLVHAGIETPNIVGTLEEYVEQNRGAVDQFKEHIAYLHEAGFQIAINTGRGGHFSKRVAEAFFPQGSVDKIICESGALILSRSESSNQESGLAEYESCRPQNVNEASVEALKNIRTEVIEFAESLGGQEEPGSKEVLLSLNPPKLIVEGIPTGAEVQKMREDHIEDFFGKIREFIQQKVGAEAIMIGHSLTAVDISPLGVDKLAALSEVVGEGITVYFGDAPGDEKAMLGSAINVTPGNAFDSTKNVAKGAVFGIVAPNKGVNRDEISGVTGALRIIEVYLKYAKRHLS